ncbi:hypothetical protein [Brevundimonas sp. Root1423]|uniref:hypothetical protein n=1 Tax=Brevundimonas sp. Root1423 TaxID=1736462 RepID=UPI0006FCB94B|nr:hypothetical protein [Brevundimonas sp. Root1423]KQY75217.1 hypothetical protein ASD25_11675 [Brevundimonas sp. Root1423]
MLVLAIGLGGCSTVDFSQPEIPLPPAYSEGANIRMAGFSGWSGLGSIAEGPSLSILHDQLAYGAVRCSRSGPPLDLTIDADFATVKDAAAHSDHLIGVATWRDPATRQVVGRHHLDVEVRMNVHDRSYVSVDSDEDNLGSSVPQGQLAAGEAFVAQVCEKAFGWRGLPG